MMLDFPNSPTTGQIFSSGKGTFSWDGTKWVPVFAGGLGDAPSDGSLYGRLSAAWSRAVKLAGDTMTGALLLSADPTAPLGAATKQYVDGKTAGGGGLVAFNVYSSSQTITIPAGATKAIVEMWGGTGGSGGVPAAAVSSATTAAAGFLRKYLTGLVAGNTLTFTLGAAGAAGAVGGAGGAGGASTLASGTQTIATLTANGSAGGPAGAGAPAGGTVSGGDLNVTGQGSPAPIAGAGGAQNTGVAGQTMYSTGTFGTSSGGSTAFAGFAGQPGGMTVSWYA